MINDTKSQKCSQCGRSISLRSESLVDETGCLFCREGEDDD